MQQSHSSKRWLKEHQDDVYVKRARSAGYRSRAVYKLLEIDDRDRLLAGARVVVDLGAAPGGWSQVALERSGGKGRVVATDILPMEPLAGVEFIQGDFRDDAVLARMVATVGECGADLVMSDMAPNMSGVRNVDQPRAMYLSELALDLARRLLGKNGDFVAKVFQGEGFDEFIRDMRRDFARVATRKPRASRPRSREVYVLGRGYGV